MRRFTKTLLTTLLLPTASGHAKDATDSIRWKQDCVGILTISLPGEVDFSSITPDDMLEYMKSFGKRLIFTFPGGQIDEYSKIEFKGKFLVTHPLDDNTYRLIYQQFKRNAVTFRKNLEIQHRLEHLPKPSFQTIEDNPSGRSSYRIGFAVSALAKVNTSAVAWSNVEIDSNETAAIERNKQAYNYFSNIRSRAVFDVPASPGLCMAYQFLPNTDNSNRFISTGYRLKSHPDITIWLQDSKTGNIPTGIKLKKPTVEYDNEFFWSLEYQNPKKYRSIWPWPHLHKIKLAGMEGKSSFMELTRDDDTIDYGFFASSRSEGMQPDNPTNIQMFIVQNSKNAILRKIQPLEKDKFLELAQTIAASIKKRPITTP